MARHWSSMPIESFFDAIVRGHALPDSMKHHLIFESQVDVPASRSELCSNLCTTIESVFRLVAVLKTFGDNPEGAVARYLEHVTSQQDLEEAYAALDDGSKGDMAPRDTSRWKEQGGDSQDILPDCGVYPTRGALYYEDLSNIESIVERTEITPQNRRQWLRRISCANILIPIFQPSKAMRQKDSMTHPSSTSAHDSASVAISASQQSVNSCTHAPVVPSSQESDVFTSGPMDVALPTPQEVFAGGQIDEYIGQVFARQQRTHLFSLCVFKSYACLFYSDRVGTVVSEWFSYGTSKDTTLQDFFYRFAWMTSEAQGLDPTARRASPEDAKKMLACAKFASLSVQKKVHDAIGWDETTKSFDAASQWPFYEINIAERTFLVGRPLYVDTFAVGRCTRTYVARDIQQDRLCVLKDSWRPDNATYHPEHLTYKKLQENGVQFVLSCEVGGDVPAGSGSDAAMQATEVQSFLDSKPTKRIHYRIVLKEVCLPVTEFSNFRDLVYIMCTALLAHQQAWENAGVLHRDISVGNILIYEDSAGQCAGLLSDWDLCKYKDELATGKGPPDPTGTWQFRSALSLRYPRKPYGLPDDIESFIHVIHYLVVRYAITDQTTHLKDFVKITYDECTLRELDGAHVGGSAKLKHMDDRLSPIVPLGNPTLVRLLAALAGLCNDHRHQIALSTFDRLYGFPDPLSVQMIQASTPAPAMDKTPAGNAAIAAILAQYPRAPPSGLSAPSVPALVSPPSNPDDLYGASPFRTHQALLQTLAMCYGTVSWEGDLKSADLFTTHMQSSGYARSAAYVDFGNAGSQASAKSETLASVASSAQRE